MQRLIEATDLSKRFLLRHNRAAELKVRVLDLFRPGPRETVEPFWALRNVTFAVERGEAVAFVGRNGSGKSTLLKLIAGIYAPSGGSLRVANHARIGSMIELGLGFHPELTGQENVCLNAAIHGLSRPEIEALYQPVVEYSGLAHFMDVPLKNYSSGMQMRLAFSVAANLDPEIFLLDEIFAVGDEDFQKRCVRTLQAFRERNKTILFVSHSAAAVQAICRRTCVLDHGQLFYDGEVDAGLTAYRRLLSEQPRHEMQPVADAAPAAEPDLEWHRLATGGQWGETGRWLFELARQAGLRPDQHVLEVGCGSLAAAVHFLPFMDNSHYWGYERQLELLEAGVLVELPRAGVQPERGHFVVNDGCDLSEWPHRFDLAVSSSLFRRLPLNAVALVIANVLRKLAPGGRIYATWLDGPSDRSEPATRADGLVSYPDREPYHYSFDVLARVCEAVGARAARVDDASHPQGESVMVITPAP